MGKRSSFDRNPRDFYPTPREAVYPLLRHLAPGTRFAEPCAGNGALVVWLEAAGMRCTDKIDLQPMAKGVMHGDALSFVPKAGTDMIITNPPWDRKVLHPMIEHFAYRKPTWLLFDADWMHTKQAAPYLHYCRKIVSVGRVKWIPDSKMTGKDNCAWYLFDQSLKVPHIEFYGR